MPRSPSGPALLASGRVPARARPRAAGSPLFPGESPSDRVLRVVRAWLEEGRTGAGERLPSENAIARELSVARGTVRAALRRLQLDGLVESRPKQGWFRARARRGLVSDTVVFLTHLSKEPDPTDRSGWMQAVESGAAEEARRSGLDVFMANAERLSELGAEELLAGRPVGVIVSHQVAETERGLRLLAGLAERGLRVVVNCGGPGLEAFDRVVFDHESGARELARFLFERGRRRVLRVWSAPPSTYWLRERDRGYERACSESGVKPLPAVLVRDCTPCDSSREEALELRARHIAGFLVEQMLSRHPPDALMLTTDPEVFPAARACRLFGKRVPEDVELVGYDNVWSDTPGRELEPTLPAATIDKHNREAGRLLTRLLLDRAAGKLPPSPQQVVVGPELVKVRAT